MHTNRPGLSAARKRLSRRVGLRAFVGLFVVFALASLFVAISGVLLQRAIQQLGAGELALSMVSLIACGVFLYLGFKGFSWLNVADRLPEGVGLRHEGAASLRRLIARAGRPFGAPRIDSVRITGDMNAAVAQRPRWGLVGPMHTCLSIGLPLLHSVSDRQLAAILAHEFGHLVLQRNGIGAWACHMRAWWFRVVDRAIGEVPPAVANAIDRLSVAGLSDAVHLAHLEEFEADEAAARVAGTDLVGATLIEIALKEHFLTQDYWRKVMAQAAVRRTPSIRPYREMGLGMAAGFRRPASTDDPRCPEITALAEPALHPDLSARLRALGVVQMAIPGDECSVAADHLRSLLPGLALSFDRRWWAETRHHWRRDYRQACHQNASRSASR